MSTELATVEPLLPMDPASARQVMERYQETTRAWLNASDWIGEPGDDESFVKRSGWDKIATAYNLSVELVSQGIERDDEGQAIRAHAVVRATAPSGRHRDGDGGCGINEQRFRNVNGRQKIEHDLPATAVTRATNRAISNLVGFGQVSAEEVDADVRAGAGARAPSPALPEWATRATDDELRPTANELIEIVQAAGADPAGVTRIGDAIRAECDGGVPRCVAHAIAYVHAALGSAPQDPSPVEPADTEAAYTPAGGEQS